MTVLKIGLTGGIASGKTTVADMFKHLAVDVFDADIIAKELVEHHAAIRAEIFKKFGTVERAKLREIIFHNSDNRVWLEKLLHPQILQELKTLSDNSKSAYCILVIPLLFEAKCEAMVDYIVVVDSDETLQKQRLKQRDQNHDLLIDQILNAQISRAERLPKADFVISNDKDLEHLLVEVKKLHQKFLEFCALK